MIAFTTTEGVILVNPAHIVTAVKSRDGRQTVLKLTDGQPLWITQDLDTVAEWLS